MLLQLEIDDTNPFAYLFFSQYFLLGMCHLSDSIDIQDCCNQDQFFKKK